jgi:hypothetical protein
MASSSRDHSESEEELPQISPKSGRKKMRGGGNPLKPPKAPKKKKVVEPEEVAEEIPIAISQPEDDLVTDALTLFSDGNPKNGGHGREKNTTVEMCDPENYKTPPGHESTTDRTNRLQRFRRHWAKKWFRYENIRKKY